MSRQASSDGAERFVTTADAKSAVEGHEEEILGQLGIDHRAGKPHITCPYPDHGGENDWRWDERKAAAYCTCSKGDSILDVVMKCEGLDFDAAKVRAVEMVGQSSLIKTRGGGERDPENKFQKTDAKGLFQVKREFRDDHLVAAYLGSRLGVPASEVLLPSTPYVGITKKPYFEPGKKKNGEPKVYGTFPCVVFQQVSRDGKIHAHRIWTGPGGRGKADLGGMDPKKSAKKLDQNENTNGRVVYWGNPEKATHCIVCEGIETAAAVAHALRDEIGKGSVMVASAIHAAGITGFRPWPAAKRVTVAADRDDAEKRGKVGSQTGTKAAREFCLYAPQGFDVRIATPGETGESLDWLDIFERDGEEAVRAGVLGAEKFVPTKDEADHRRSTANRDAELESIAAEYPLPILSTKPLRYLHDQQTGRVKVHKGSITKDGPRGPEREEWTPISTPFGIVARLRHADQADVYSLRLVVMDMNGRRREIDVRRDALPKMAASEIRSLLLGAGLRVEEDGEAVAVACLKAADPDREILLVHRPAWHGIDGLDGDIFVAPDGAVFGSSEDATVELDATVRMLPSVAQAGTLDGWRNAVATALGVQDCPHWALGVMAGFAGPLIALTNLDTCGINLSGMSSSGKSTAQKLAASAWSTPDIRKPGLFQSARSTNNAIEALAGRASGTVLSLDELAHVPGKEVGKIIYTIAGGVGKSRMKADASMRSSYTWSTFAILSAESSLEEKVRSDGGEWMAGMAVRIADVDVTGINRSVDQATMGKIYEIDHNHGHAGHEFIRHLISEGGHQQAERLRQEINNIASVLAGGEGADSARVRSALPFAILAVAGGMAQKYGLLPESADLRHPITWAWSRFQNSSDAKALSPSDQAISNLRLWIAERWGSSIRNTAAEGGTREAQAWFDADYVYIPRSRIREACGNILKEQEIVAALKATGGIGKRTDAKRDHLRYIPKIGTVDAYALPIAQFGRTSSTHEPDAFRVHQGGRHDR